MEYRDDMACLYTFLEKKYAIPKHDFVVNIYCFNAHLSSKCLHVYVESPNVKEYRCKLLLREYWEQRC